MQRKIIMNQRPRIGALNSEAHPDMRAAMTIGELPDLEDQSIALRSATHKIGTILGLPAKKDITFDEPVYLVFMSRPAAKAHPYHQLLLNPGCDVRLEFCEEHN
jgi:hypothetical protein